MYTYIIYTYIHIYIQLGVTGPLHHLGAPQYARQMQASRKEKINSNRIIMGGCDTLLTPIDISTGKKISKES